MAKVSLITFSSSVSERVSELETPPAFSTAAFDLSRVILEKWNKPFKSLLLRDIFAIFSDFTLLGGRLVPRGAGGALVRSARVSLLPRRDLTSGLSDSCGAPGTGKLFF